MERTVLLAHPLAASPFLVVIPDLWLTFIIGVVLPAIVALVTKRFADSAVKAGVLVFLSVLGGIAAQVQAAGGEFDLAETAVAVLMTFVTAVAVHFGLLKPINVTGENGVIARAVPGGIGSDVRARENTPDGYGGTPSTPVADPHRAAAYDRDGSVVDGDAGLE